MRFQTEQADWSQTGYVVLLVLFVIVVMVTIGALVKTTSPPNGDVIPKKPRRTKVKRVRIGGTEIIKKKAGIKKAEESSRSCLDALLCRPAKPEVPMVLPAPPFGIDLQDPTSSEITIFWNAPSETPVPVDSYKIYKRFHMPPQPPDWSKVDKPGADVLEYRITRLLPERKYVFGVASVSGKTESIIVESEPVSLNRDPVRPGAPCELECVNRTSNSITLSWKPPRKGGYSRIHTYYLMIKDLENGADWALVGTLQAFDRYMDYRVTGLSDLHAYRFRVTAENAVGIGPSAETVTLETTQLEPERPSEPKGPIKFARISHQSITLSWQAPLSDGGKPITGYAVEYREKDSDQWHKAGVCGPDVTRHTVGQLPEDIEFYFRVVAMNDVGNSDPLVGGKVKTKLLEIPLSRRSSFRMPSRIESTRDASGRSRPSVRTGNDVNVSFGTYDDVIDDEIINSPFVPQSDFYNVDESEFGNISTRHSENKTRHSQFSPLPKVDGNFTNGYIIQDNGSAGRNNMNSYSEENETKQSGSNSERRGTKRPLGKSVRKDGPLDYRHTDDDLRAYVSPVPRRTGQYFQDTMSSTHSSDALPSGRSYKAGNALANPSNVIYGQRRY